MLCVAVLPCVISVLVAWWVLVVLDGSGGWVASSIVVVGRKKQHGNV